MTSRRRAPLIGLAFVLSATCRADPLPADCPTDPTALTDMPLAIGLGGRPGVPAGLSGYVFGTTQVAPNGTTCQAADPALPADVLHGDRQPTLLRDGTSRAGVLTGPGPADLLRGGGGGGVGGGGSAEYP